MHKQYTRFYIAIIAMIAISPLFSPRAYAGNADQNAAVIFVYQRVGEDSVPDSNISLEQFQEHITELKKGGYSVLPLPQIMDALKNGNPLPPKTIGITFEGAYQTTLANAVPLLEDAQLPFTVFFASDMADGGAEGHLSWSQIKKLRKNKLVNLGILPAAYEHMVNNNAEQNAALINRAIARYREMLDTDPVFFAYPYGEYSLALKKQLAGYHFKGVFGQQSGVVDASADFLALPRFTMTDEYGDLDRFRLTANALPLPVSDVVPEDTLLAKNPPVIGFTVAPEIKNISKLSCFISSLGKVPLNRIGSNRIEIRLEQPFLDRRMRVNCTLPNSAVTPGEPKGWRWFGMMLILPSVEEDDADDGSADTVESSDDSQ